MLATNFPDEDHVHQAIKPVDLNNLPTKRDPNLIRRYAESCPCGAIRMVPDIGVPATPWYLSSSFSDHAEGTETPDP